MRLIVLCLMIVSLMFVSSVSAGEKEDLQSSAQFIQERLSKLQEIHVMASVIQRNAQNEMELLRKELDNMITKLKEIQKKESEVKKVKEK